MSAEAIGQGAQQPKVSISLAQAKAVDPVAPDNAKAAAPAKILPSVQLASAQSPTAPANAKHLTMTSRTVSDASLSHLPHDQHNELIALRSTISNSGMNILNLVAKDVRQKATNGHLRMSDLQNIVEDHMHTIMAKVDAKQPESTFSSDVRRAVVSHLVANELVKQMPHLNESDLEKGAHVTSDVLKVVADIAALVPGANFLSLPINVLAGVLSIGAKMMGDKVDIVDEKGSKLNHDTYFSMLLSAAKVVAEVIPGASVVAGGIGLTKDGKDLLGDAHDALASLRGASRRDAPFQGIASGLPGLGLGKRVSAEG